LPCLVAPRATSSLMAAAAADLIPLLSRTPHGKALGSVRASTAWSTPLSSPAALQESTCARLLAKVKELTKLLRTGDFIRAVLFTNHPDEHAFSEVAKGKAVGSGPEVRNQTELLRQLADKLTEIEMRYEIDAGYNQHHIEDIEHDICPQEVSRITLSIRRQNTENGAATAKRRTSMDRQYLIGDGEYNTQTNWLASRSKWPRMRPLSSINMLRIWRARVRSQISTPKLIRQNIAFVEAPTSISHLQIVPTCKRGPV